MTRNGVRGATCRRRTSSPWRTCPTPSDSSYGQERTILANRHHMMNTGPAAAAISEPATWPVCPRTATISTGRYGTRKNRRCTFCPTGRGTDVRGRRCPSSAIPATLKPSFSSMGSRRDAAARRGKRCREKPPPGTPPHRKRPGGVPDATV